MNLHFLGDFLEVITYEKLFNVWCTSNHSLNIPILSHIHLKGKTEEIVLAPSHRFNCNYNPQYKLQPGQIQLKLGVNNG